MFSMKYSAVVNTSTAQNYFGTSKRSFKERYITITQSFRNKQVKKVQFSNYKWELKKITKIAQSIG